MEKHKGAMRKGEEDRKGDQTLIYKTQLIIEERERRSLAQGE